MPDVNGEELRAEISKLVNQQMGEALTKMPKGHLEDNRDRFAHAVAGPLVSIARHLELNSRKPDLKHAQQLRALARTSLGPLANYLAAHLVDYKNELEGAGGFKLAEDSQLICDAVKMIRRPEEMPELVEAARELTPLGMLCIDAAQI